MYYVGPDGEDHYLSVVNIDNGWITFNVDPGWVVSGENVVKYAVDPYTGWYTRVNEARLKVVYKLWICDREMMCQHIWVNEDNMFQFVFLYPYVYKPHRDVGLINSNMYLSGNIEHISNSLL